MRRRVSRETRNTGLYKGSYAADLTDAPKGYVWLIARNAKASDHLFRIGKPVNPDTRPACLVPLSHLQRVESVIV